MESAESAIFIKRKTTEVALHNVTLMRTISAENQLSGESSRLMRSNSMNNTKHSEKQL